MTPAEALRALCELRPDLPPGAMVTVPLEWLSEALSGIGAWPAPSAGALAPADLTVADLAARYGRSKATARGWCEAGRFSGAYRMHGSREWRVPPSAVEAFDVAERQRSKRPLATQRAGRRPVNLGAWRETG